MNNYLTFGGIQSDQYGVWISGAGTYNAPGRELEYIQIPGRSGDLIVDKGRYSNIEIVYPAYIHEGFDEKFDIYRALMLSKTGYQILTDTYHPDEFRLATLTGGLTATTGPWNKIGGFDLRFNCQPQRWLNSGLTVTTLSSSGSITNPTNYASRPNIRVYGYGTIGIGSETIAVAAHGLQYIDIDCQTMDAFCGATNANSYVTITGDDFPTLKPGSNNFTLSGHISNIQITPRWFTI